MALPYLEVKLESSKSIRILQVTYDHTRFSRDGLKAIFLEQTSTFRCGLITRKGSIVTTRYHFSSANTQFDKIVNLVLSNTLIEEVVV